MKKKILAYYALKVAYYAGIMLNALPYQLCQNYAGIMGAGLHQTVFARLARARLGTRLGFFKIIFLEAPCYVILITPLESDHT